MNRQPRQRISIVTLGCSKNTVDSEVLMHQINNNGMCIIEDPNKADTVIINTCGFIDVAKEESVNTILEASEMKKAGIIQHLYVAGCLSERHRAELETELPEVDKFFGVTDFAAILETLGGSLKRELLGERHLSTPSHTAYLKISEGCDHPCSFCSIPQIRGKHASKRLEEIVHEAKFLQIQGTKELVLIAQDTTSYGLDLYGEHRLPVLLDELSSINGIEWIRLMYAYPSHFPLTTLDVMRERQSICRYIDLPIQHIDDAVLKSMRRGISERATKELLNEMRKRVPGIALRTTLIVGYPGETDKAFDVLYDFIAQTEFDRLGVFLYSQEEHTASWILGDPIPHEEKITRRDAIMELQREISAKKNQEKVGQTLRILLDTVEGEYAVGRSEFDAPEVDNEVLIHVREFNTSPPVGKFVDTRITEATEYDLTAVVQR